MPMRYWKRRMRVVTAEFDAQEVAVLRGLVGQLREMLDARHQASPADELAELTGIRTGHSTAPDDTVMARLLPSFHRPDVALDADDPQDEATRADSASALRSLHEPELLDAKITAADVVLQTCPERSGAVRLSPEQAQYWLRALNDVRLALGTMLEVTDDSGDAAEPSAEPGAEPEPGADDGEGIAGAASSDEEQRAAYLGVYHWVTVVQDDLVGTLW